MSKHDDIMRGLGLHGQAVVATIEMMADLGKQDPELEHVARRIGIPVAELRRIFPDDQSLLIAVAEQALVRLIDSCTKAVVKIDPDDAVAQFLALGIAYVRWAADHRTQFRLINGHPTLNAMHTPKLRRYLDSVVDLMTRMLERAQKAGHLREDEDISMIVLSSRTFAYGLARMVVDGRMDGLLPCQDPLEAAELAMADFVKRFASRLETSREQRKRAATRSNTAI
ncbi:TetR/AcrR family transcriptional regulator [Paracoccus benzoatiresistens]|uniref:TetR-like C-terminal domain-containing protein n=1 Tax=Paracoccus benzoatiresistens TaxID=2997341 RepID=A0ABT4J3F4_9RHOB|nr:TetR-like C-terminal domain-containing protein [Paracoccus sp. EF6]MCZ0961160.1 TetR-like C-terminal domain-containing protein [Paracoccus sp. EF6]